MKLLSLITFKSFSSRKLSISLTLATLSVSLCMLICLQAIYLGTQKSFQKTISQTDLIVSSRGGDIQNLLYTVFHIGKPVSNIKWQSFKTLSQDSSVKWAVPISLGDSHRGFRVVGTLPSYFKNIKYGTSKSLEFLKGKALSQTYDVVIGYEVFKKLNYPLGKKIKISHGVDDTDFQIHKEQFLVTGVLKRTFTPMDRSVFVTLKAIDLVHGGGEEGAGGVESDSDITAFFVGLKSKIDVFKFQRKVNTFEDEALSATLPGIALMSLWKVFSIFEKAFLILSILVALGSLCSLGIVLFNSIDQRKREMAIYRSLGARPSFIILISLFEGFFISLMSIVFTVALVLVLSVTVLPVYMQRLHLEYRDIFLQKEIFAFILGYMAVGLIVSFFPAIRSYRSALKNGLYES